MEREQYITSKEEQTLGLVLGQLQNMLGELSYRRSLPVDVSYAHRSHNTMEILGTFLDDRRTTKTTETGPMLHMPTAIQTQQVLGEVVEIAEQVAPSESQRR